MGRRSCVGLVMLVVVLLLWCTCGISADSSSSSTPPDAEEAWAELRTAVNVAHATLQYQTRLLNHLLNNTRDIKTFCSQVWWCPPPYQQMLAECFFLSPHDVTWQEARSQCQSMGGDLATPAAVARLFSFLLMNGAEETDRIWVGGTDRRGPWRWINGRSIATSDWSPRQPNNWGEDQHCLNLRLDTQPSLNDANCELEYRFACQYIRN